MGDLTNAEIDAATERGRKASVTEPRVVTAQYDDERDCIVVELTNDCVFSFPPRLAQGLESASRDQVAEVEVQALVMASTGSLWTSTLQFPACRPVSLAPGHTSLGSPAK